MHDGVVDTSGVVRRVACVIGIGMIAVLVAGCGGDGSGGESGSPSGTGGILPSPTRSIEEPTRSADETEPSATRTGGVLPPVTDSVTLPEPSATRTGGVLPTVTETAEPPATSAGESTSPTAADADDSGGTPDWVWWALGALLLALAISIPLLMRQRRRRAWREDLAGAEEEVAWFARVLVPSLRQAGSLDQVAGGWGVSSDRVLDVENRLNALTASPPDDDARARVSRLRDVVRGSREQIQQLLTSGTPDAIPRVLSLVSSELESALTPQSHRAP